MALGTGQRSHSPHSAPGAEGSNSKASAGTGPAPRREKPSLLLTIARLHPTLETPTRRAVTQRCERTFGLGAACPLPHAHRVPVPPSGSQPACQRGGLRSEDPACPKLSPRPALARVLTRNLQGGARDPAGRAAASRQPLGAGRNPAWPSTGRGACSSPVRSSAMAVSGAVSENILVMELKFRHMKLTR